MILDQSTITTVLTLVAVAAALYWVWCSPAIPADVTKPSNGGSWVSIAVDQTVIYRDGDELVLDPLYVDRIKTLSKGNKLVLIATATSDGDAQLIEKLFDESEELSKLLPKHRLLFSEKEEGRISIVRQLQPSVHFDSSAAVIAALTGKTPKLTLLTSPDSLTQ